MQVGDLNKVWEIKALKRKPTHEGAKKILDRIAKQVQPIMQNQNWRVKLLSEFCVVYPAIRASQSMEDKSKVFKGLGMFALRKKIEDVILLVEELAPTALEWEKARRLEREEVIRGCDFGMMLLNQVKSLSS